MSADVVSPRVVLPSSPDPPSVPQRLRQRCGPLLNRFASAIGQPITHVYPEGYVGTIHRPIGDVESALSDGGFSWDPLSMYHHTPEGDEADGSWAYRSSWLADRQLHVVLFAEGDEVTEVYAHDEFNWSRHPIKHAQEIDIRRNEGSTEMRRWMDARDIEYEHDPVPLRKFRHAVTLLGERLDGDVPGGLTATLLGIPGIPGDG